MKSIETRSAVSRHRLLKTLMLGTALGIGMVPGILPVSTASAQASQTHNFDIPSQPLNRALRALADQSGVQIAYRTAIASGASSPGVSGSMSTDQALSRLLAGTGLMYNFTSANTVMIGDRVADAHAPVSADGSLVLDTITVSGGNGGFTPETPYETAAPVAYISGETIERFRGSSPADMFRGTPGVMSGEARNGAGSVDVNIRGMQGMGRVSVTVDGAENSLQVYQGYQGISNRTYVDPDLLAGVDITKGADAASSGIAGTVAMRTLQASDIIQDGKSYGIRLKGGFGTNTSSPQAGSTAGYDITNNMGRYSNPDAGWPTVTSSSDGMDRPSFLKPTQGSASVVAAMKAGAVDLLAGYAYRKRGNYHAGTHGAYANPVSIGPQPYCSGSRCFDDRGYRDYIVNDGLVNYRAGEEVLNTELETESWLAKGTLHLDPDQSLELSYTGYRAEAGDLLASLLTSGSSQAQQQEKTTGTRVDTGTLKYRWNPEENDLVNLKANLWISQLEQRNAPRNAYGNSPESLGLPSDFRVGTDSLMWGANIDNTSSFFTDFGSLAFTYGASYKQEETAPSDHTREIETWLDYRDGERQEAAAYAKLAYNPWDWLTVTGGLRYSHFWTQDRNDPYLDRDYVYDASLSEGGFSPSVGVTLEPWEGTQFYVNYSNAMRLPSLFESVSAFSMQVNTAVRPERSSNWEIGTNFIRDSLIAGGDRGMLKVGFFDWDVDNYISREWYTNESNVSSMRIHNIDRAHFQGIELSARYELGGFTAALAANYYTDVTFCRTAGNCENKSLYADYATNQVPPEYSIDLTLSQKLFEEKLTVGGRVSRVGPRAIGHGDATASGMSAFISMVDWDPYTLVDLFAEYKVNDNVTASFTVKNVTDQFYVDPLSLVAQPGPGRTFYASLTAQF